MRRPALLATICLAAAARGERLELANGRAVEAKLVKAEEAGARIEFQGAQRVVPWAEIRSIAWPEDAEEKAVIAAAAAGAPLVKVMDLWHARQPWLSRPRSTAGSIGLAFAGQLASRRLADERQRARDLYTIIAQQDWDPERRDQATLGLLQLDLREGKLDETAAAIAKLDAETRPGLAMDARHALALARIAALEALEKERPKWQEEDDVLPRWQALRHAITDALLYPALFHGADEVRATRGLETLAKFCEARGDKTAAASARQDLQRLYPKPSAGS